MNYPAEVIASTASVILFVFTSIVGIVVVGLAIASYVLSAISLMTISKRRGLDKVWLSWIPVLNGVMVGKIADDYMEKKTGEKTQFAKRLFILAIITICSGLIIGIVALLAGGSIAISAATRGGDPSAVVSGISIATVVIADIALACIAVVYYVFYYMAIFKVYRSCKPATSVPFLIISIVVTRLAEGLFLFLDRKYDDGLIDGAPQVQVVE